MTTIVELDPSAAETFKSVLGEDITIFPTIDQLRRHLDSAPEEYAVVLGPSVDVGAAVQLAENLRITRPTLGVILVRRRTDTAVLADALRSGMREVVEERDLTSLTQAVRRAHDLRQAFRTHEQDETVAGVARGRMLTVFSAKGGVGKTTLSTNMAVALADGGRREVCLVDLDLAFGDVAITLQLLPAHTIADAVAIEDSLDLQAVESLLTPHSAGVTALVAPVQPDLKDTISAHLVGRILRVLKERFDFVVVDTPPAFDDVVLQAFDESDLLVLIATLDIPALKNLKLSLETLDLLNYPRDQWRIVLNRADSKVGLSPAEVQKTLRLPISLSIPSSRDVPASVNRGVPIVLDDARHPVSQTIRAFAGRCAAMTPVADSGDGSTAEPAPTAEARRGLLRRKVKTA